MRLAAKRDTSEKPIKAALEAIGARVWQISAKDLPDLLVAYNSRWWLVECKTGKSKLRDGQKLFCNLASDQQCTVIVARTAEEAINGLSTLGER